MLLKFDEKVYDNSSLDSIPSRELKSWFSSNISSLLISVQADDFWSPPWYFQFFYSLGYYTDPSCYGECFKPLVKSPFPSFYFNHFSFLWIPKTPNHPYHLFLKKNGFHLQGNCFLPVENSLDVPIEWNDKQSRLELDKAGYYFLDGKFVKEYDKEKFQVVETHLGKELRKKELLENKFENVKDFSTHWLEIESKIKNKELLEEMKHSVSDQDFSDLVSPQELLEKVKVKENREKIRKSLYQLLKWKSDRYKEKYSQLLTNKKHIETFMKRGDLTPEEVKDTYPMYSTLKVNLITLETLMEKITEKMTLLESEKFTETLLKDFQTAINEILSIRGKSREKIRRIITTHISTLLEGPQAFIEGFQNIILTGSAGIGKTRLAYVISHVYTTIHVLVTDNVVIVSKQDFVAPYLGQTGPKTVRQLFNSLDGVLVIDEAYQLSGCPGESNDSYATDAMTEIVNFVDKYIGLSMIIAAGYREKMMACFLKANQGMPRRFSRKMHLENFSSVDLYELLFKFLQDRFSTFPLSSRDSLFLLFVIHHLNITLDLLDNQAGDMENLASFLTTRLLAKKSEIDSALVDFLASKEFDQSQDLVHTLRLEFEKEFPK